MDWIHTHTHTVDAEWWHSANCCWHAITSIEYSILPLNAVLIPL